MCYIMEDGEERGSVKYSNFNIGTERAGCKFRNWGDLIAEMAELFIEPVSRLFYVLQLVPYDIIFTRFSFAPHF